MYTHLYIYIYVYICVYTCHDAYIHTHICICIYIHIRYITWELTDSERSPGEQLAALDPVMATSHREEPAEVEEM